MQMYCIICPKDIEECFDLIDDTIDIRYMKGFYDGYYIFKITDYLSNLQKHLDLFYSKRISFYITDYEFMTLYKAAEMRRGGNHFFKFFRLKPKFSLQWLQQQHLNE